MILKQQTPRPEHQKLLEAYKCLPPKDRVEILIAVSRLLKMKAGGNPPSKETMLSLLNQTGQLEIAIACYTAQLLRIDWR